MAVGDVPPPDYDSSFLIASLAAKNGGNLSWYSRNVIEVDVTQQVKKWLNGSPNYGIVIMGADTSSKLSEQKVCIINSKDNTNESHAPEIGATGATGRLR